MSTDVPKYRLVQWLYDELGMERRQIARYLRTSRSSVSDALNGRARKRPDAWRKTS